MKELSAELENKGSALTERVRPLPAAVAHLPEPQRVLCSVGKGLEDTFCAIHNGVSYNGAPLNSAVYIMAYHLMVRYI